MELDVVKKLIKKNTARHARFVAKALEAKRYYENEPDILTAPNKDTDTDEAGNPIRNADNRIPRNFHGFLVNQKAAYMFTAPPVFEIGSEEGNKAVVSILGDDYAGNCMDLCVNAANAGVAWIHYWENDNSEFEWAVCPSTDIIPLFNKSLKKKLLAILRTYRTEDEETGEQYIRYEYWTDTECQVFQRKEETDLDVGLGYCNAFIDSDTQEPSSVFRHNFGAIPFIPFWNNKSHTNDLKNIKPLIDVHDKVFSGFINDLDDVQQLIFILTGYGGQDLKEFLADLKKYKAIKIDNDEDHPGGVNTLSIEIPIEARNSVLEATRRAIFEQGFGFDPRPESFGTQSGVALKFMYALLEMKVGLSEVQFRSGFNSMIRAICRFKGIKCDSIIQTWTRTCIQNDLELSQICQNSVGVVSRKTILRNHPFVEDAAAELEDIEQEEAEAAQKAAEMYAPFTEE